MDLFPVQNVNVQETQVLESGVETGKIVPVFSPDWTSKEHKIVKQVRKIHSTCRLYISIAQYFFETERVW